MIAIFLIMQQVLGICPINIYVAGSVTNQQNAQLMDLSSKGACDVVNPI
jgi:hypothetical protein